MKKKISVIIAAYNEEKLLPSCLEALKKQVYPKEDFEVIVIDNNSSDRTAEIAKSFKYDVYRYTEIQGCGASRAFGIERAKGSIFAFIDPDVVAPSDWLMKIDKAMQDERVVCISGRPLFEKKNFWTTPILTFYDMFYLVNNTFHVPLVWGFTMAIKRQAYDAVGGIDKTMLSAEDWDLALRLQNRFGKKSTRYAREVVVYTSARKENNKGAFLRYVFDSTHNYINVVLLKRKKIKPVFNIR